ENGRDVLLDLHGRHEGQLQVVYIEILRSAVGLDVQECLAGVVGECHRVVGNGQLHPRPQRYRCVTYYSMEAYAACERRLQADSDGVVWLCRRTQLDPHADRIGRAVVHLVVDTDLWPVEGRRTTSHDQAVRASMSICCRVGKRRPGARAPSIQPAVLECRGNS